MNQNYPTTYAAKRKARRFAVQGVYEWQMSGNAVHEIEARTRADNAMHKVDISYYHELLSQVVAKRFIGWLNMTCRNMQGRLFRVIKRRRDFYVFYAFFFGKTAFIGKVIK